MSETTLFISAPQDFKELSDATLRLTNNRASGVRLIGSDEALSADPEVVDVVVMQVNGQADYAVEIHWKGLNQLSADAVGMYVAIATNGSVIVSDASAGNSWLLLSPGGIIEQIDLDVEQMNRNSTISYRIQECQ